MFVMMGEAGQVKGTGDKHTGDEHIKVGQEALAEAGGASGGVAVPGLAAYNGCNSISLQANEQVTTLEAGVFVSNCLVHCVVGVSMPFADLPIAPSDLLFLAAQNLPHLATNSTPFPTISIILALRLPLPPNLFIGMATLSSRSAGAVGGAGGMGGDNGNKKKNGNKAGEGKATDREEQDKDKLPELRALSIAMAENFNGPTMRIEIEAGNVRAYSE